MEGKYLITKKQSDDLYTSLKLLHNVFVEMGITYFLAFGTLLGAVRHQGIIPHDDDGDLCIFKKDVGKLRKLIPYFDKLDYTLSEGNEKEDDDDKMPACLKRRNSCTWYFSSNGKHAIGIDIFIMYAHPKTKKITYYDPYWETASTGGGKTCYFTEEQLFPLLPYRFGNFFMYGPHNAIEHLNRCYGPDWNSKGQVLYDHRQGKFVNTKKKNLKPQDFLTLRPPKHLCDITVPDVVCAQKHFFKAK